MPSDRERKAMQAAQAAGLSPHGAEHWRGIDKFGCGCRICEDFDCWMRGYLAALTPDQPAAAKDCGCRGMEVCRLCLTSHPGYRDQPAGEPREPTDVCECGHTASFHHGSTSSPHCRDPECNCRRFAAPAPQESERCGATTEGDVGACVLDKGHGGYWHDDGVARWPVGGLDATGARRRARRAAPVSPPAEPDRYARNAAFIAWCDATNQRGQSLGRAFDGGFDAGWRTQAAEVERLREEVEAKALEAFKLGASYGCHHAACSDHEAEFRWKESARDRLFPRSTEQRKGGG